MITYTNEDCMAGMARYPDKHFDLAIVDPPYGIGINQMVMGGRKTVKPTEKRWDDVVPDEHYFKELFRVSKNQIVWGGNYFNLPASRCFIVWDKGEAMYGRSFAECEFAWTSIDASARVFKINPMQLDRFHPTQKPVILYKKTLALFAQPGYKILDTHVGSASSLIACHDMGFDAVGFELDTDYYKASKRRLEDFMRQPKIEEMLDMEWRQESI